MMEIRKPKFELGQKVVDKNGNVETVLGFNSYHFEDNEYWYDVSYDEGTHIKKESFLKPYIENSEPEKKTVWDLVEGNECYLLTLTGHIYYNHDGKVMIREYYYNVQSQGTIYFDSSEQLHKVVNEIGLDRIKKYIFGV